MRAGHGTRRRGFDVMFTNAHRMLRHLHASYIQPDLLVIDDFGFKPLTSLGAEDLYDVINERYEKGSILITSNRAPGEWASWFTDPPLASAGLDRLAHNAHVIVI